MMAIALLDRILGRKTKSTASIAKERLTLVLAHERSSDRPVGMDEESLKRMQEEILAVVTRYFPVDRNAIQVHLEKEANVEILEVNVILNDQQTPNG
jgi:cell division topological specificity factor